MTLWHLPRLPKTLLRFTDAHVRPCHAVDGTPKIVVPPDCPLCACAVFGPPRTNPGD